MDLFLQLSATGLVVGSLYVLCALGWGLIYGTTLHFHVAHGAVFTLAAYYAYAAQKFLGLPLAVAVATAIIAAALSGMLIDLFIYQPLERRGAIRTTLFIASLGLLTLNALTTAHRVLVPLQCEYYALEGLTHLMATIDRVKAAFNPDLEVEGIVLTMFDGRNSLTHQVADEVKAHFRVFDAIIPRNVKLSEAPSHGKPALLYDAQSKGAQGYLSLAREILDSERGSGGARASGRKQPTARGR